MKTLIHQTPTPDVPAKAVGRGAVILGTARLRPEKQEVKSALQDNAKINGRNLLAKGELEGPTSTGAQSAKANPRMETAVVSPDQ